MKPIVSYWGSVRPGLIATAVFLSCLPRALADGPVAPPGSSHAAQPAASTIPPLDPTRVADDVRSAVQGLAPSEKIRLIATFSAPPDSRYALRVSEVGGMVHRSLPDSNSYALEVPVSSLPGLLQDPSIARVSYDWPLKSMLNVAASATGAIAAQSTNIDGDGIVVAVIDSGIAPVRDLKNLVLQVDMLTGSIAWGDPYGHGTHIAGLIAGSGNASNCGGSAAVYTGIAPQARLISVRVLDGQ